jgi:peptidoglycan/xylan/chitin deacetylase (PgdA/CDA1 family)
MQVALTLDAEHPSRRHCPPGVQEALLEELARASIRATFFIQGRWAKAYPETARAIAAQGHLIGNHSHYHARLPLLSDQGLRADIVAAQEAIAAITGTDPRPWFRCPFGDGADDPRVQGVLHELGYRDVFWHVDGADWDAERSSAEVQQAVLQGIEEHGDAAIVLFHTWPATTLEIIPAVIGELAATGAEFVAVDALPAFAQK